MPAREPRREGDRGPSGRGGGFIDGAILEDSGGAELILGPVWVWVAVFLIRDNWNSRSGGELLEEGEGIEPDDAGPIGEGAAQAVDDRGVVGDLKVLGRDGGGALCAEALATAERAT